MKLRVKPNDGTGYWEIHDESGFLCNLESQSTAALIAHAVNVLPDATAALELAESAVRYHHAREGCPMTLQAVRAALRKTRNINPRRQSPAHKQRKESIP